MKEKLVTRYTCDHCGRRGYSKSHMRRHEARCIRNLHRVCGMCEYASDEEQPDYVDLLWFLHWVPRGTDNECDASLPVLSKAGLKIIRTDANECPACVLALITQAKLYSDYDFKAAKELMWAEHNQWRDRYL